ncbi:hypothetical protein DFH06DRAFT_1466255 [Mycena polygramma]|nr:hypothetical protein DFH06DRAFT_1466255 [Mycena polygramma]
MSFAALGEDILLTILSSCDVCTVLSVSAVNKVLRRITCAKQLWLSLIQAPTFRDVLELPPLDRAELETHSTIELVGLVKRIVDGPSCPPGELLPRITFHAGEGLDIQVEVPCLLPGARYAVLRTRDEFRLYDVRAGLCIWQHPGDTFLAWSVDFVPGKSIARVMLGPLDQFGGRDISVHEVDLRGGHSREVFSLGFTTRLGPLFTIVGDFFMYQLPPVVGEFKLVLVNWSAKTYVVVKYDTHQHSGSLHVSPHATLLPGSIVVAYAEITPPHQLILTVTDLNSFSGRWKPLTGISLKDQISPQDVPFAAYSRLEYDGRPLGGHSDFLTVASALDHGAYRICISATTLPIQQPRKQSLVARVGHIISVAGRRSQTPRTARQLVIHSYYKLAAPAAPGESWRLRLVTSDVADTLGRLTPRLLLRRAHMTGKADNSFVVSYYD